MLVKGHHNPTIYTLKNTDPNKYFLLQHYKTLQGSTSTAILFILRGIRIETTQPLRTAVALLHGIYVWILR